MGGGSAQVRPPPRSAVTEGWTPPGWSGTPTKERVTPTGNETTNGLGVHESRARATANPAASTHNNELNTHDEKGRGPGFRPGTLSR